MSALSALVGGGADCGPSNPLAQMSKQFGNDRGAQQDHYTQQTGGRNTFRSQQAGPGGGVPDEAGRFFASSSRQPAAAFDLSPLNRALTPPAWAQAFVQNENMMETGGSEQEAFRRAFASPGGPQNGVGASGNAWSGQFEANRQQSAGVTNSGRQSHSAGGAQAHGRSEQRGGAYQYRHPVAQARLYGQGFAGNGIVGRSRSNESREGEYASAFTSATQDSEWETAFLAQESTSSQQHQSIVDEPTQRPHSPVLTATQSRDALAYTAGQLLDTVHSSEQVRASGSSQESVARNDKFAKSTFLDLMRKLRDGEVAVEGDKVVEQIGQAPSRMEQGAWEGGKSGTREEEGRAGAQIGNFSVDGGGLRANAGYDRMRMGPGAGVAMHSVGGSSLEAFNRTQAERKEMNEMITREEQGYDDMRDVWAAEDVVREAREVREAGAGVFGATKADQFQGDGGLRDVDVEMSSNVVGANAGWEEDFDAETIVGGHSKAPLTRNHELSAQEKEWDLLQNDWETFDATATGIKAVDATVNATANATATSSTGYSFASANPYFASTRNHSLHTLPPSRSTYESVLEREAAVLQNPTDSHAWLALGIKQQENEREEQAILALTRALQLDPDLREAYLALAVSYTNENERGLAYESIDRWIDCLAVKEYAREIEHYRDLFGRLGADLGISEKHDYLTGMLIRLAQSRAEKDGADVDADVQIGLGVLFNTSEEYDKAGDCFESALSVRPDDPLLFNRLGATLANGGKAELAIQYYLEAIEIQPSYVRARFNLAVANMNLNQHQSAAEHLITALSIQESDSEQHNGGDRGVTSGVTSQALWDSLNIALLMMHRNDLAAMCGNRDLAGIKLQMPVEDL